MVIDPGQAFGTGAHHTTRLCLELLLELDPDGALADWGCGSGVLAIAAARLGWDPVLACDWEAASVEATRANAAVNGVPGIAVERLDLRRDEGPWAPVVVANLIRPLLLDVAGLMTRPPRTLIVSGLLREEAAEVGEAFGALRPARVGAARRRRMVGAAARRVASRAMAWNVLILGGGFGGLTAARRLERKLAPDQRHGDARQRRQLHALHPAAAGCRGGDARAAPRRRPAARAAAPHPAATSARSPAPTRTAAWCQVHSVNGRHDELPYDQLIVALGSTSRTLPIPGLAEHALGFKTLSEAIALRNRVILRLEQAELEDDEHERAARCSRFVFVGAGYAGLEGLAELQDFAADVIERYPRARLDGVRFMLVEARDRVMPEVPPTLAAFATTELRKRGIEVRTNTTIEAVTERHRDAVGRRGRPGADARLDRRRQAAPGGREARAAARRGRPDRRRPLLRGAGPSGRLGDRRRRRRPRPGEEGPPVAADRPARPAPGQGRRRQRRWPP